MSYSARRSFDDVSGPGLTGGLDSVSRPTAVMGKEPLINRPTSVNTFDRPVGSTFKGRLGQILPGALSGASKMYDSTRPTPRPSIQPTDFASKFLSRANPMKGVGDVNPYMDNPAKSRFLSLRDYTENPPKPFYSSFQRPPYMGMERPYGGPSEFSLSRPVMPSIRAPYESAPMERPSFFDKLRF